MESIPDRKVEVDLDYTRVASVFISNSVVDVRMILLMLSLFNILWHYTLTDELINVGYK